MFAQNKAEAVLFDHAVDSSVANARNGLAGILLRFTLTYRHQEVYDEVLEEGWWLSLDALQ